MPIALLSDGIKSILGKKRVAKPHFNPARDLKKHYDVVIIGGGGHACATAYYLSRYHGVKDIAILEKGYLAGGNTARNTAVLRSNYITEQGVKFYRDSLKLYTNLSNEFGYNVMWENRGQLTLASTDAAMRGMRWRAEVNKHLGVRSEVVDAQGVQELVPDLNLSENGRYPVLGGLWHADGGTARHDAVAWGYAKGACERGVEIHQLTEVLGINIDKGVVNSISTNRGTVGCGVAIQAVAGMSSHVAKMAGLTLPIHSYPLQAMVTQPYKPFLTPHVSAPHVHVYIHQTSRGELVIGGGSDPYALYNTRSTLEMKESLAAAALELFPFMSELRLMRQWAGITDMTPDYSPIMGLSPVENYYLDAGWGTWGFKATPIVGKTMAELVATRRVPDLIAPFCLDRFYRFQQVNEAGATAASH
jgi:sarcosine oxidase subunit beta